MGAMKRRVSSSESDSNKAGSQDNIHNIRTKPPHIYDNITRRLLQFGITLSITTFIGLIVRYAVQEFDPSVSTITVTTSRVNNRDIASLSVSKHFLERILEFVEEAIAIVAAVIPLGFPLCTIFNKYFAKIRAGQDKIEIKDDKVLNMIPKYVVIGDAQACQMPTSARLRPLVRDTIYQLIKSHLKPKLIVEDSFEEARKLGIKIGLIKRKHHKLAVIKSVDLLRNITDSRGDIKQSKVRFLLSRMKIMSQSTPADKSMLIYLMKYCESEPNENLAYLGYSFTDPEAMRLADCALTFQDCDDDDVKNKAQVLLKSENMNFTDLYLFTIICLLSSNVIQSYALYQISASVSCCIYRFLSITVFQEQLISHSQFTLLCLVHQVFAIIALMTKWLSSLPQAPLRTPVAEMSHAATEDSLAASGLADLSGTSKHHQQQHHHHRHRTGKHHHRSTTSVSNNGYESSSGLPRAGTAAAAAATTSIRLHRMGIDESDAAADEDTLGSSSSLDSSATSSSMEPNERTNTYANDYAADDANALSMRAQDGGRGGDIGAMIAAAEGGGRRKSRQRASSVSHSKHHRRRSSRPASSELGHHIHLSGVDLDLAVINSKLVTSYKQTFHNTSLIDDVTYRLTKLHIAYQVLVMIIIMIFGNAMFQLNMNNNRQHQTLALNSLILNNVFNLANCFNQVGGFNLRAGLRSNPFFVCVLLLAVFIQVCLTELNAFGLENLNPIQWFVCLVFALLSAMIAPLTGQQQRQRSLRHLQEQTNIKAAIRQQEMLGNQPNSRSHSSVGGPLSKSPAATPKRTGEKVKQYQ